MFPKSIKYLKSVCRLNIIKTNEYKKNEDMYDSGFVVTATYMFITKLITSNKF